MNSKNTLQEIFQRRREKIPVYVTIKAESFGYLFQGSSPIKNEDAKWYSIVTLNDNTKFEGKICSSKKEAEKSAATTALSVILDQSEQIHRDLKTSLVSRKYKNVLILLDMENVHKSVGTYQCSGSNVDIIGFMSKTSCLVEKIKQYNFPIEIVNSSKKNACDVSIIMFAYNYSDKYSKIFIITKDLFASALEDLISNVEQVISIELLVNKL